MGLIVLRRNGLSPKLCFSPAPPQARHPDRIEGPASVLRAKARRVPSWAEGRTYRYFTGTPLYPFGYGLSYSKFSFSNLKLSQPTLKAGAPLEVSVDVTNTEGPEGDEVAELYITPPQTLGNPLQALRSFQRVHIAKGATEPVKLKLDPRDLSFVDLNGDRFVHASSYQITVGDGQPQAPAAASTQATLTIQGNEKLPE